MKDKRREMKRLNLKMELCKAKLEFVNSIKGYVDGWVNKVEAEKSSIIDEMDDVGNGQLSLIKKED